MTVGGYYALRWATFVLFLFLLTVMHAHAPPVPVRPYRLTLLRRHNETGSAKPKVNVAHIRRQQSSSKAVATETAYQDDKKLLPVVAFLKVVAKHAKPRVAGDIQRTTAEIENAVATRRKSRHGQRRNRKTARVLSLRHSASPVLTAPKRSSRASTSVIAPQGKDYYDNDQSYPHDDPYPVETEPSYSEDYYHGDGYSQDVGYTEEHDGEDADETYNEVPYETEYPETTYHEPSYPESPDGYQENEYQQSSYHETKPDDSGYGDPYSESAYQEEDTYQGTSDDQKYQHESDPDGYDDAYDSGYEQGSYSDSSYPEQATYDETSNAEYGHEEKLPYDESEQNDYHENHDSGYEEDSYGESYPSESHDAGAENDYPVESYPEDSYQETGYEDGTSYPQPYQPADEQPSYESNSYQPEYQPSYSSSTRDESPSYPEYDQSYTDLSSYGESAHKPEEYAEASHNKDYNCPKAPEKFCYEKEAGHYAHPGSEYCFIQCDHVGQAYAKQCAYGTSWKGDATEAAYANMCI